MDQELSNLTNSSVDIPFPDVLNISHRQSEFYQVQRKVLPLQLVNTSLETICKTLKILPVQVILDL